MSAKFCWHCGGPLYLGGDGRSFSATVTDEIGHEHLVHKRCAPSAVKPRVTAAPSELPRYTSPYSPFFSDDIDYE